MTLAARALANRHVLALAVAVLTAVAFLPALDGEFVDFTDNTIFNERFVADGNATGPIAFGGIRFAADSFSVGGEVRYHSAEADLPEDFVGPKLDLGGWTYAFTLGLRFR